MTRDELKELGYIVAIENVPSILQHGILSNRRVLKVPHRSVAMQKIQDRRAEVVVPGGRPLHEYANLYICPRNPMLYYVCLNGGHADLCVLRVSTAVLDIASTVVTDGNAASGFRHFAAAPDGLSIVDKSRTFARYWTDPDAIQKWRKSMAKCAEVLVPDLIPPNHIIGAYVPCDSARQKLEALAPGLPVTVSADLFFL